MPIDNDGLHDRCSLPAVLRWTEIRRGIFILYQMAQSFPLVRLRIDGSTIKRNSIYNQIFDLFKQSNQK